jgi:hypothetical protein
MPAPSNDGVCRDKAALSSFESRVIVPIVVTTSRNDTASIVRA